MTDISKHLTAIGFPSDTTIPPCWRVERLDRRAAVPPAAPACLEPACSRELMQWRVRLARSRRPSPYRIARA